MSGGMIVVEGVDGCGKGTQTRLLASWLKRRHPDVRVCHTHEPWEAVKSGRLIRAILRHEVTDYPEGSGGINHVCFQRLYVQNRIDHWTRLVLPVIELGGIVVSDRERMSTYAYGHAFGMPLSDIHKWHIHAGLPQPSLTFYLATDPMTCIERMQKAGRKVELFEKVETVRRVCAAYEDVQSSKMIENVIWVDNNGTIKETRDFLRETTAELLKI